MKRLDVEKLCDDIKAVLLSKLNPAIAAVALEKGDDVELKPVDSDAYMFQSMDDKVANYNPSLFYGIDSSQSISQFGALSKTVALEITIILADAEDKTVYRKILRYQRALEDVFTAYTLISNQKIKITSLEPVTFKTLNGTSEYKAIGVIIETELFC